MYMCHLSDFNLGLETLCSYQKACVTNWNKKMLLCCIIRNVEVPLYESGYEPFEYLFTVIKPTGNTKCEFLIPTDNVDTANW